jgi:hypothetical protein
VLDLIDRHALVLKKVQHHPGIKRAGPAAHHQAIKGGKAHTGGNALPFFHGAHAGPVVEVRDNYPAVSPRPHVIG